MVVVSLLNFALCCSIHPPKKQIAWDLHDHHRPPGFLWQAGFRTSAPGIGLRWVSYLLYFGSCYVPSESGHRLHSCNIRALLVMTPSWGPRHIPKFNKYIYTFNGYLSCAIIKRSQPRKKVSCSLLWKPCSQRCLKILFAGIWISENKLASEKSFFRLDLQDGDLSMQKAKYC